VLAGRRLARGEHRAMQNGELLVTHPATFDPWRATTPSAIAAGSSRRLETRPPHAVDRPARRGGGSMPIRTGRDRLRAHLRSSPLSPQDCCARPATLTADAQAHAPARARPLQRYRCAACGFEAQRYFWQCPGCMAWDSYPTQRLEDLA
jgi:hypothetical protein